MLSLYCTLLQALSGAWGNFARAPGILGSQEAQIHLVGIIWAAPVQVSSGRMSTCTNTLKTKISGE